MDQSQWSTPFPLIARLRAEHNLSPNDPALEEVLEEHLANQQAAERETSPTATTTTDNPTTSTENHSERETSENQTYTSEQSTNVEKLDVKFEDNKIISWGFAWDPETFSITEIESETFAEEKELQVGWIITAFNGEEIDDENRRQVNQELLLKNSCVLTFQIKIHSEVNMNSVSTTDETLASNTENTIANTTHSDQSNSKDPTKSENLANSDRLINSNDTTNSEDQTQDHVPSKNNSTDQNRNEVNNEDEVSNYEDDEESSIFTRECIVLLFTACVGIFFFWRYFFAASCVPVSLWLQNHKFELELVTGFQDCYSTSKTSHNNVCRVYCHWTKEEIDLTCQNSDWYGAQNCLPKSCPLLSEWLNQNNDADYRKIAPKTPPQCFTAPSTPHEKFCPIIPGWSRTNDTCNVKCNDGEWELQDRKKCIPSDCKTLQQYLSDQHLGDYTAIDQNCTTGNLLHDQKCELNCPWYTNDKIENPKLSCYNGHFETSPNEIKKCAAYKCPVKALYDLYGNYSEYNNGSSQTVCSPLSSEDVPDAHVCILTCPKTCKVQKNKAKTSSVNAICQNGAWKQKNDTSKDLEFCLPPIKLRDIRVWFNEFHQFYKNHMKWNEMNRLGKFRGWQWKIESYFLKKDMMGMEASADLKYLSTEKENAQNFLNSP